MAQCDVDHASFPAVHRVEAEGLACMLHLFGSRVGAQTKFRDAQHAVVVSVERKPRMVLGWHAQGFHGDLFESEQKLRFVREQQFDVRAAELDDYLRILNLGIG